MHSDIVKRSWRCWVIFQNCGPPAKRRWRQYEVTGTLKGTEICSPTLSVYETGIVFFLQALKRRVVDMSWVTQYRGVAEETHFVSALPGSRAQIVHILTLQLCHNAKQTSGNGIVVIVSVVVVEVLTSVDRSTQGSISQRHVKE
jgi:hypothetical protein